MDLQVAQANENRKQGKVSFGVLVAVQPPSSTRASALHDEEQASFVDSLPPEPLNLTISALLEDGPVEPLPAPKLPRGDDPGAVRAPKERTEDRHSSA